MEQPIEQRGYGCGVAEQFAPVVDRSVYAESIVIRRPVERG
jgi:hypothetical protein